MHSWFNLDQMNYDTVDNNATVMYVDLLRI
jgi:hypothetical protein